MDIHEKIVEMMSASHLTQQKLAEKLGVSQVAIHSWVTGKKSPSKANISEMAKIFGVSAAYFLSDNVNPEGKKQVPLFEWVQAGTWTDFCNPSAELEYIDLPYGVSENCFAVRVRGNSMSRAIGSSICDGSIVFCEPMCDKIIAPELLNHKVVIAQYRDSATIKEFICDEPCYLSPWNPDRNLYPNLPLNDEVRIIGVVVAYQFLF
jgi:SOS-response transcriptional repressor LexA